QRAYEKSPTFTGLFGRTEKVAGVSATSMLEVHGERRGNAGKRDGRDHARAHRKQTGAFDDEENADGRRGGRHHGTDPQALSATISRNGGWRHVLQCSHDPHRRQPSYSMGGDDRPRGIMTESFDEHRPPHQR